MIRTQIQLEEEQYQALKELAETRKVSMAKLIRESVAQYIVVPTTTSDYEVKRLRALEFINKIKSGDIQFHDIEGKTDVSINHDKYLAEIYGTWKS